MLKIFKQFAKDESGATAIEYGLIAALIAVALIGILTALGSQLNEVFSAVNSALGNAVS